MQPKELRSRGGCIVPWDFKEEEDEAQGDEKQTFSKQMFSGPCLTVGHSKDLKKMGLARFLPITLRSS